MIENVEKRRVLLLAMAAPTGIAGHHYSMRDLARAFSRYGCDVEVVLFSRTEQGTSPPLAEFDPEFVKTGVTFYSAIRGLRRHIDTHAADLVLAFDETSNRIATCALLGRLEVLVPVKPGGVTSSGWSAASSEMVVFTAEDQIFFNQTPKYRKVRINHISGRVETPPIDQPAVARLRAEVLSEHDAKVLAICPARISEAKRGFIDSVLRSFEDRCQRGESDLALLIIGVEQDPAFRRELEARTRGMRISIRTDSAYTRKLSSVLTAGDEVYALGRTVMEALLQGCRVFCPTGRKETPFWEVTAENFLAALSGNFTGRNQGQNLYVDTPAFAAGPATIGDLTLRHISSDGAVPQYLESYARSIAKPPTKWHQRLAYALSRSRLTALDVRAKLHALAETLRPFTGRND